MKQLCRSSFMCEWYRIFLAIHVTITVVSDIIAYGNRNNVLFNLHQTENTNQTHAYCVYIFVYNKHFHPTQSCSYSGYVELGTSTAWSLADWLVGWHIAYMDNIFKNTSRYKSHELFRYLPFLWFISCFSHVFFVCVCVCLFSVRIFASFRSSRTTITAIDCQYHCCCRRDMTSVENKNPPQQKKKHSDKEGKRKR